MAIYRPPKPRWPLALGVGIVSLLIGTGVGLALASGEPDPVEVADDLRADLVAAAGSLEVAGIEYAESVSDGEVIRQAEYDGALDAIESGRARYREVSPVLRSLAASIADEIEGLFDECSSAMRDRQQADQVSGCLTELSDLLKGES